MKHSLLLAIVLAAPAVSAKCVSTPHVVSGTVVDAGGAPAVDAKVAFAWSDALGVRGPYLASTDANGRYEVTLWFNTYSKGSFWRGDICKASFQTVSVAARHSHLASSPRAVAINGQPRVAVASIRLMPESSPSN